MCISCHNKTCLCNTLMTTRIVFIHTALFILHVTLAQHYNLNTVSSHNSPRTMAVAFIENFIQHTFSSKKAIYRKSCRTLLLHGGIRLERKKNNQKRKMWSAGHLCTALKQDKLLQLVKEKKKKKPKWNCQDPK